MLTVATIPSSFARDDALPGLERLLDGRVLVPLVELLAPNANLTSSSPDAASRSYPRSFSASPARTTPSTFSTAATTSSAAISADAAGVDEARHLDPGQSRSDEAADELGLDLGEHVRLVLEAVPRPDVEDGHARGRRHAAFTVAYGSVDVQVVLCGGRDDSWRSVIATLPGWSWVTTQMQQGREDRVPAGRGRIARTTVDL